MVRDPRAIINSYMLSDRIFENYKIEKMLPDEIYKKWLIVMDLMHTFCMTDVGRKSCIPVCEFYLIKNFRVFYENINVILVSVLDFEELVIKPVDTFKKISQFLNLKVSPEHLVNVRQFIEIGRISTFYTELPRMDEFNLNWTQINKYGFDSLNFMYPNLNFQS